MIQFPAFFWQQFTTLCHYGWESRPIFVLIKKVMDIISKIGINQYYFLTSYFFFSFHSFSQGKGIFLVDKLTTNKYIEKVGLGTKLISFEKSWIWLTLAQISGHVNEIYPKRETQKKKKKKNPNSLILEIIKKKEKLNMQFLFSLFWQSNT